MIEGLIQGEFYRYNAQLNSSFRYDVLRYYERMDAEARVIKQQMVDSLQQSQHHHHSKMFFFCLLNSVSWNIIDVITLNRL